MQVKVKRLTDLATLPKYATQGDAAMDLHCTRTSVDAAGNLVCNTGLAMEIPEGYVGLLFPRSSVSKTGLCLSNSVGVVDSGYRGEIILKFRQFDRSRPVYHIGDRVGQIMILPYPQFKVIEVDELSSSQRGKGGFGSTGN